MRRPVVYLWKQVPFLRILLPFISGIILQFYLELPLLTPVLIIASSVVILLSFFILPERLKFSIRWLQGLGLQVIFLALGAIITYNQDIRHRNAWIGNEYNDSAIVLARLKEPLVAKTKSFKALASVEAIKTNGVWKHAEGNILVYFKRENTPPSLDYGSQIVFSKPLQEIRNSGNPGAFNYQLYCAFQDIYHQVFLKQNEYANTTISKINPFWRWLYGVQAGVITSLQKYIHPEREAGVAEALLIGYRDDLDKNLVQAYSNTGVVHIIAISGLHLGLIYVMLVWVFKRFKKRRWIKWIKPIVILAVLWIFTLVAGAAPSILRSAVMFTCIVLGETIDRKTSIYNTLAASAFLMLCYNPYFLWDVGFQLSYAAVISIITFMKPIYNLWYIKNKSLDGIWQLNAVTLSAQILTLPLTLFHFHQFPNLFLITNFIAVPASTLILYAELLLLAFSKVAVVAIGVGKLCSLLLLFMNSFIELINDIPFALADNIYFNIYEAILLFITILSISYWLLKKNKIAFFIGITAFVFLIFVAGYINVQHVSQQKIIVYNIPQHTAIDIISGNKYQFVGDSAIPTDNFLQNFHLKPARTLYQARFTGTLEKLFISNPFIQFNNTRLLLIDKPYSFETGQKIKIDAIIISKNPRIYIHQLQNTFDCNQYIFDASNPEWKIRLWKKDCDSLHLRHHSTAEKGAFELDSK